MVIDDITINRKKKHYFVEYHEEKPSRFFGLIPKQEAGFYYSSFELSYKITDPPIGCYFEDKVCYHKPHIIFHNSGDVNQWFETEEKLNDFLNYYKENG